MFYHLTVRFIGLQHWAMDSLPPNFQLGPQILYCFLKPSFRCLIFSFEQQRLGAEKAEVRPLVLDCCRIFSTISLAEHTKLGSLVVRVHALLDMPQKRIHIACNSNVVRLTIQVAQRHAACPQIT